MSRYGAALWSGDTASNWRSLQNSVGAGLNVQLSGIAWWTTDIGGYKKGDTNSSDFRQLIVRWFQFGLTCPLFRQHGKRATEPWLFGEAALGAIEQLIALRYRLVPYLLWAVGLLIVFHNASFEFKLDGCSTLSQRCIARRNGSICKKTANDLHFVIS